MSRIATLRIAQLVILVSLAVGLFVITTGNSRAHTVTEVGEYAIIAAWDKEPVVVGERNTIFIDIMRNNRPIASAEARMNIELESAEKRKPVAASGLTTEATLRYAITFIPTVPGRYDVHLSGLLGEDTLEVTVAPEEVLQADVLQFPDVALSNGDLQDALINIEDRLTAAQQQSQIALFAGGLGVIAGVVGILVGVRKSAEK